MRFPHFFLSLFLLLSSCSTAPASNLYRDMAGKYTLNSIGAEFFALHLSGSTIPSGAVFDVNNAGEWSYNSVTYFTPVENISSQRAVYRLIPSNSYFALMLVSRNLVMISTNTSSSPKDADFSFLFPIAVKK